MPGPLGISPPPPRRGLQLVMEVYEFGNMFMVKKILFIGSKPRNKPALSEPCLRIYMYCITIVQTSDHRRPAAVLPVPGSVHRPREHAYRPDEVLF